MISRQTLTAYYYLTKPGIVYGNALAATAGYLYGANGSPMLSTFIAMLVGICAVMASACVYNNVMDKDIDLLMERTKKRAVPMGLISERDALLFATILLVAGLGLLLVGTNLVTALVALAGHFAYVILYGYAKRKTVHGTLVGTLSGSTPPVIGYVAATGALDVTALLLFLLLASWQMAHFYAIAIFRRDDYAKARIPVLSVVKGLKATRAQIFVYIGIFLVLCLALGLYGGASLYWVLIMLLVAGYWLYLAANPVEDEGMVAWARKQFGWSLWVLLIMSLALSLDSFWH